VDIRSGGGYPCSALSTFAPHRFVLDGIECVAMEGLHGRKQLRLLQNAGVELLKSTYKKLSGIDCSTSDRRLS
jgi:hypothetical protein